MADAKVCKKGQQGCGEGYLQSTGARQIVQSGLTNVTSALTATGDYRFYEALARGNPNSPRFTGLPGYLYLDKNLISDTLRRTLPNEFRPNTSDSVEVALEKISAQKRSGGRLRMFSRGIDSASRFARLGIDFWAMNTCAESGCTPEERAVILADASVAGTEGPAMGLHAIATNIFEGNETSLLANRLLKSAHLLMILGGALQVYLGYKRWNLESAHFMETGDANTATKAYALADGAYGIFVGVRSTYGIGVAIGQKCVERSSTMMIFNDLLYSPVMKGALATLAVGGTAAGMFANLDAISTNNALEGKIDEATRLKNIRAAEMGMWGWILMLAGSLISLGYSLNPYGLTLFIIGNIVHMRQSIYEQSDEDKVTYTYFDPKLKLWLDQDGNLAPHELAPDECRGFALIKNGDDFERDENGIVTLQCIDDEYERTLHHPPPPSLDLMMFAYSQWLGDLSILQLPPPWDG